jgi:hypothetical protein
VHVPNPVHEDDAVATEGGKGGGLVDAPSRGLVGAKENILFMRASVVLMATRTAAMLVVAGAPGVRSVTPGNNERHAAPRQRRGPGAGPAKPHRSGRIGDAAVTLHAFHLVLSHSRMEAIVWAPRQDELAWLTVHNGALTRLGGVPAVIRVDNTKTAIAQGAGAWGTVNERYAVYARTLRFHVDATRPRAPEEKGKVERRILAHKVGFDPRRRAWRDVAEFQTATDVAVRQSAERRLCPATGDTVWTSFLAEHPLLQPLPAGLPEPFDLVAQRRVGLNATVHFEGRMYSVPFRFAEQVVEIRGCADTVQVWAAGAIVAMHPRHTRHRLLIDPTHYDGPSTDRVVAPTPLGRMGRKRQEIWALAPQRRPIDLYAALAEVAR